jgi:hypothetical protein
LYAVWEVDPYTVGKYVENGVTVSSTYSGKEYLVYNTIYGDFIHDGNSLDLTSPYVIIDWRGETSNRSFRMTTGSNVVEVVFLGDKGRIYNNITTIIPHYAPEGHHQIWEFVNFNCEIAASNYLYECNNFTLEIKSTGDCSLTTSMPRVPIFNMPGVSLVFTGNGNITVRGGNGTKGADGASVDIDGKNNYSKEPGTGENGTDGSPAIVNTYVTIACDGTVTLIGGHGGRGGNGGQVKGESNSDGYADLPAGGNEGNGGNGGMPIDLSLLNIIKCGKLQLKYGDGGNGGDGAMGGNAYEVTDVRPDNGGNGGHGGHGGNGFVAGNGGSGGQGGHSFGAAGGFLNSQELKGTSGDGGNGGNGGKKMTAVVYTSSSLEALNATEGGNAGSLGSKGTIDNGGGVMGNYGQDGKEGTAGSVDNTYYNAFENQFSEKLS